MQTALGSPSHDKLVWAPDAPGSACFPVSGYLPYVAVGGSLTRLRRRDAEWWIAAVSLVGCVAFGISAVASSVAPSTGAAVDLAVANVFTALGALLPRRAPLLLRQGARSRLRAGVCTS
jgi:hypothetical protein